MKPAQPSQCRSCIFRTDGAQAPLAFGRLAEIVGYLIEGHPHLCHHDETKACRGGRDLQLEVWHRVGIIAEPTDAALESAMRDAGVDPAETQDRRGKTTNGHSEPAT